MYNQIGQRVKGRYFSYEFTGTIKAKTCVNNGRNPAYAYLIELDSPIETSLGLTSTVSFNDRDQRDFNNVLELIQGE